MLNRIFEKLGFGTPGRGSDYRALRQRNSAAADEIARDLGLSSLDLDEIAAGGREAAYLHERMLSAYGIAAERLPAGRAERVRDIAIICSRCREKRRCGHELAKGTARQNAAEFCPNADALEELAGSAA